MVKDWRIQDYKQHKQHRYFKKQLGREDYWTLRIAQKIHAAVRLRQRQRDPTSELGGGSMLMAGSTNRSSGGNENSNYQGGAISGSGQKHHQLFPVFTGTGTGTLDENTVINTNNNNTEHKSGENQHHRSKIGEGIFYSTANSTGGGGVFGGDSANSSTNHYPVQSTA